MFHCNHHHQGAHYMSLLNLQSLNSPLKYIGLINLVVWLHILSGPCSCMSAALFRTSEVLKQCGIWWCGCICYQDLPGVCLPHCSEPPRFQTVRQTYTSKDLITYAATPSD